MPKRDSPAFSLTVAGSPHLTPAHDAATARMAILITGMSGFIGSHLAQGLLASGQGPIYGAGRRRPARLAHPDLTWLQGDLRNPAWVRNIVQHVQPASCFHLAAQSHEGTSWRAPWHTYEINLQCQLNLLEALRTAVPDCRVLIASSCSVYGFMQGTRIREDHPLAPVSPYGASKMAQEGMALQYARSCSLQILVARTFNIIGPRQSPQLAISSFARQIAWAEADLQPPLLQVGNLEVQRDFLDVRDLIRAWCLLMACGQAGEVYNVASGRTWPLRFLTDTLRAQAHRSIEITEERARLRPAVADPPRLRAHIGKLQALGDWAPAISLEQTLHDMLQFWRACAEAARPVA